MGSSFIHGRYADIRVIGMENAQTKSETSILKMLFFFFCGYTFLSGWRENFSAGEVFFCVNIGKKMMVN